jgi:hypothetical protein
VHECAKSDSMLRTSRHVAPNIKVNTWFDPDPVICDEKHEIYEITVSNPSETSQ